MHSLTVFRSARIVTPQEILRGDLVIENGRIVEIISPPCQGGAGGGISKEGVQEIDCNNLTILPGLIDTHVHFRDPGLTEKEDFNTGTQAAAAGGVTTIFDMPNTNPPTISSKFLQQKKEIAQAKASVNYNFFVGLTDNNFEEINQIKNIAGIKIFFGSSTGNLLVNDLKYLKNVFQNTKHLLAFHAEDENIIQRNLETYKDDNLPEIHSKIRSREAEISAVESVLKLATKFPQTRVHLCHISTKEAVELLEKYNLKNVTSEVSMHHLLLNETAYIQHGNFVKINPPLRPEEDNHALQKALKDGIIQTIATDHAPHLKAEKEQDYWKAPSGMPMVELTLPLLIDLVTQNKIKLEELARWTASNPAEIFKIKNKGKLEVGFDADFTIVDLKSKQTIQNDKLFTKCKWTPFDQKELEGMIVATYLNGECVFEYGKIVKQNFGKEVKIYT